MAEYYKQRKMSPKERREAVGDFISLGLVGAMLVAAIRINRQPVEGVGRARRDTYPELPFAGSQTEIDFSTPAQRPAPRLRLSTPMSQRDAMLRAKHFRVYAGIDNEPVYVAGHRIRRP